MFTLAFNTSNNSLSIALLKDDNVISSKTIKENGRQAELLILEIENILKTNNIWYDNIDLITTVNGPGSFTGVRIGLIAARTIRLSKNIPLILLNSCEVIASKYHEISKEIITILDARMDEFFYAHYYSNNEISKPKLIAQKDLINHLPKSKCFICGSGKEIAKELLSDNFETAKGDDSIDANLIGSLAYERFLKFGESKNLDPLYLRNPIIG